MSSNSKHNNYEILNLIGYGLAKFDREFVAQFNVGSKAEFYEKIVSLGVAETVGTVKNRQDLFDPFFDNSRKGWWQKGNAYIHRKEYIDVLFGDLTAEMFTNIVQIYLAEHFGADLIPLAVSPIIKSRYKQLQETGLEAELFFNAHYRAIPEFANGELEDARLYGDGYDFQVAVGAQNYLAEIKGVRKVAGSIRLTQKEFLQAQFYQKQYVIVVVSSLEEMPKMTPIFDPILTLEFREETVASSQVVYRSINNCW